MDIPLPHFYVNGRLRDSQLPTILATGIEMMEKKFSTDWTRQENRLKINRVLDQSQEGVGLVHSDALFVGSLQVSEYNAHTFKFGPCRERRSVYDYYKNEKNITLQFPFLPLIYLKGDEGSMFPVKLILLHSHRKCVEAIEKRRLDQKQRDARKAVEKKNDEYRQKEWELDTARNNLIKKMKKRRELQSVLKMAEEEERKAERDFFSLEQQFASI